MRAVCGVGVRLRLGPLRSVAVGDTLCVWGPRNRM